MKKSLIISLVVFATFIGTLPAMAAEPDMKMISAQLKYIKENADLSQREYNAFSKIYIDYNRRLYEIGQRTPPAMSSTPEEWNRNMAQNWAYSQKNWQDYADLNKEYFERLEKKLSEESRRKIYDAQMKLWQKMWDEWQKRSEEMIRQWNQQMQQWQGNMQDSIDKWQNFYKDYYKLIPEKE